MEQATTPEVAVPGESALIVVRPFGRHAVGDLIDQTGIMRETLRGENAGNVVVMRMPKTRLTSRNGG